MTQPPPQDGQGQGPGYGYGYGGQQPPPQPPQPGAQPPQQPGPYGAPPPQPPGPYGGDNPYAGAPPQQAPQPGPYGYQPPGQQPPPYGQFPAPPPPPGPGGGGRRKTWLIVAGVVVVAALAGGGVLLATSGDGKDDKNPVAEKSSAAPTESTSKLPSPVLPPSSDTATPTDAPDLPQTPDETDGPAERPAGETGYQGQWQNDKAQTLTIGAKMESGSAKGKNSVSWIDSGGKGICSGIGQPLSGGRFRIAVSCVGKDTGDKVFAANLTQASDVVTLTWDKGGGTVKLPWLGSSSS